MKHGHAKKRYGQHFLHDPGTIDRIVRAIDPRPGERLVEVGPGRGAITAPVLALAGALACNDSDNPQARSAFLPLPEWTDAVNGSWSAKITPSTTSGFDCQAPNTWFCTTHFDSSRVTLAGVIWSSVL